ncbi:MAG: hypothetical protein AVDCRST_MAG93-3809, partial [uncultured Chloroflexia bacterium]
SKPGAEEGAKPMALDVATRAKLERPTVEQYAERQ